MQVCSPCVPCASLFDRTQFRLRPHASGWPLDDGRRLFQVKVTAVSNVRQVTMAGGDRGSIGEPLVAMLDEQLLESRSNGVLASDVLRCMCRSFAGRQSASKWHGRMASVCWI